MRQLLVQVPQGYGQTVIDIANACDGTNLAMFEAAGVDRSLDLVFVHISNGKVEALLNKLQDLPDLSFTLLPTGVLGLHPPANAAPDQVTRGKIPCFVWSMSSVRQRRGDRMNRIRANLTQAIQAHLLAQGFHAMPLVNVIVLEKSTVKP